MLGDSELAEHSQPPYRVTLVMSKNPDATLTAMNTMYGAPADGGYPAGASDPHSTRFRKTRWFRWGAGITLAGFLAGGGIALAVVSAGGDSGGRPGLPGARRRPS